ncbi:MAG: DNA mismatch repair protein MutS [Candidatus Omnitrophica bacterium]|nr:DNA mismatch repair protein MutS [Candidatus Omnitrophota bacterium]
MQAPTPMLKQYRDIKARHQDAILFFRLGDFYEMFFEDATQASSILDLVLTSRGHDASGKVPMCGVPYHSSENYIAKLIKAGKKVAICEQVEDPALAQGIVKRDVIRIISSGTYLDESVDSRYLISISPGKTFGVAFIDNSGGTIFANELLLHQTIELLAKLPVCECLYPEAQEDVIKDLFSHPLVKMRAIALSPRGDWAFNNAMAHKSLCDHFSVQSLKGFGVDDLPLAQGAAGALLEYLKTMNKTGLKHIDRMGLYTQNDHVFISPAAHYGLELESLLSTIDLTATPMGRRALRFWLYHPLKDTAAIRLRQEAAQSLAGNRPQAGHSPLLVRLGECLKNMPDLQKALSRISCGCGSIKDILNIRQGLLRVPLIAETLAGTTNPLLKINDLTQLRELLTKTINPDVPLAKPEGRMVQPGIDAQLDELKNILENGRVWLAQYQAREIKKTGIPSLKVGFTTVFGFYIEISKARSQKDVPAGYVRKQTLVNAERYITPELKEYEEKFLTAQDKILNIEKRILDQMEKEILAQAAGLHEVCNQLAHVDCLFALGTLSLWDRYIFPQINDSAVLEIKEARHPVVEKTVTENFIANDLLLDTGDNHLVILTGPNMAGKSTYIRQNAILVIMAQMGAPIPAQAATIGVVDKIFTRIGAHDDIAKGQSTFMVEMTEAADILNNLTPRSLVILDEVGRGTSTSDGLSLAWALAEHMHVQNVRTLFATHFHELIALAGQFTGVKNYNVAVREWKDKIIFMHKIVPGGSDDSYGIYVAKLAGIPESVIKRSKEILSQLEIGTPDPYRKEDKQLSLFTPTAPVLEDRLRAALEAIDINTLTPVDALKKLDELKKQL